MTHEEIEALMWNDPAESEFRLGKIFWLLVLALLLCFPAEPLKGKTMSVTNDWLKTQASFHRKMSTGPIHSFSRDNAAADQTYHAQQTSYAEALEELLERREGGEWQPYSM